MLLQIEAQRYQIGLLTDRLKLAMSTVRKVKPLEARMKNLGLAIDNAARYPNWNTNAAQRVFVLQRQLREYDLHQKWLHGFS